MKLFICLKFVVNVVVSSTTANLSKLVSENLHKNLALENQQ